MKILLSHVRSPGWEGRSSSHCGLSLLDSGPQGVSRARHCGGGGPQLQFQHPLPSPSDLAEASCFFEPSQGVALPQPIKEGAREGLPGPVQVNGQGGDSRLVPKLPAPQPAGGCKLEMKGRGGTAWGYVFESLAEEGLPLQTLLPPFSTGEPEPGLAG